jgi:anti-sigma B factor antagonist
MQISESVIGRVTVIRVAGSLDAQTSSEFSSYLIGRIRAGNVDIVLDLSQVDFMSSAGIHAVLTALKESRRWSGALHLAAAQPGVERTLQISGFTRILNLFPTVDQAVTSFEDQV